MFTRNRELIKLDTKNNNLEKSLREAEEEIASLKEAAKERDERLVSLLREKEELSFNHRLELQAKESEHKLKLQEKEFEITHYKDNEVKALQDEKISLEKKVAVMEKQNELLERLIDFNGDIVDVKDLIANLMAKLPEVKISNITAMSNGPHEDRK